MISQLVSNKEIIIKNDCDQQIKKIKLYKKSKHVLDNF